MFADRLKQLRSEKGLVQKDMAIFLNITTSAYGYYEQGKRNPDPKTLIKLSDFFNVSVDYLLDKTDIKEVAEQLIEDITSSSSILLKKDSIDIEKEAEEIIENINKLDTIKFCGTYADEEDKEYLKLVSERFLSDIRVYNKQKYTTPKKNSIEEELEAYRAELEAEEKEKTLSASEKQNENLNQKHA